MNEDDTEWLDVFATDGSQSFGKEFRELDNRNGLAEVDLQAKQPLMYW